MIQDSVRGLSQLGRLLLPSSLMRLAKAGALEPRTPLGLAAALPWLIGRGPSLDILLRSHAVSIPVKTAVIDVESSITYKQLEQRTNALARHLIQRSTTSVATLLRNGRQAVETLLASQRAGARYSPLNTWSRGSELQALLKAAAPDLVIASGEWVDRCLEAGYQGEVLVVGEAYEDVIAGYPNGPLWPFGSNKAGDVVIHTSGTTGAPKGARRDPAGGGLGSLLDLLAVVPYRRDDLIFCPVPLFHSFGLLTLTVSVSLGASLVLPERFDASEVLTKIAGDSITAASFTPVMIRRVIAHEERAPSSSDLSGLRIVLSSGAFLPPELRIRARSLFGDVVHDLYGSTEAGWVAIATPDDMRNKPSSVGRPAPGTDVKIVGPQGTEVPSGETGRIGVAGEMVFSGYTGDDEVSGADGLLYTGDVGRFDDDGYLYVEGRADEMVVIGGENVYPVEVEQVIERLAGVIECAVVGVEDDDLGMSLGAWVEGSVTAAEVKAFCAERLSSFKVPRHISVVEELPRNATGKVLKRQLTL